MYETRKKVKELLESGLSACDISKRINISERMVYKHKKALGLTTETKKTDLNGTLKVPGDEIQSEFKSDTASITTKSLNIQTLDQALDKANVDREAWDVDRYIVNSWEVTMGAGSSGTKKPETYTNFQVKVWLKRKVKPVLEEAINNLISNIKPFDTPPYNTPPGDNMLEISLFDHHFGMLAWRHDTGEDYDLKIARTYFTKAVQGLLKKAESFPVEKICFPIGNDFFHIDDQTNETPTGKNKLDTDGRLAKVFEYGFESCVHAINLCARVAPVHIMWVPGNHDPQTSYYLCKVIEAFYRNDPNVTIDTAPLPRKYLHYGVNLIGFTHGNEEPHRDLPAIMANEQKDAWANTVFREWHVGHVHKKKETLFLAGDTYGGVAVKVLPSLSKVDYWHFKKGYVGGNKMAEAYLWNKNTGYSGHFSVNTKEIDNNG